MSASAYVEDVMRIEQYDIDITVQTDRKVVYKERIVMTAREAGSRFTRSLPMEGNRYMDMSARCVGEDARYYVNSEDDYLNVVCVIETPANTTRVFEIEYTIIPARNDVKNGMQMDVVGFGWTVPLHNVTVTMHFPEQAKIEQSMISRFGEKSASKAYSYERLSEDGKTYVVKADVLDTYINDEYNEEVAEGIYVRFTLPQGTLKSFASTQFFVEDTWKIFLIGFGGLALALVCALLFRKKREIITTVNVTAPDKMDPMKMGKLLDGNVDNEDVTSMIYYFAHKGYLTIDLSDEDDPAFTRLVEALPEGATAYEKSLFDGLFKSGATVHTSDLREVFYKSVEKAKKQLLTPPMYEKKSIFLFLLGGLFALVMAFVLPFWLAKTRIGGGYTYILGFAFLLPVIVVWALAYIRENYRYKWKKGKQALLFAAQVLIAVLFSLLFIFAFASHVMTRWEKVFLSAFIFLTCFVTLGVISRKESYVETLGQILGFKDFILYTEADKIKVMLEENPTLYYKVLPYAQVLGVTDEWTDKFKGILLEPPKWCSGGNMTVFDYIIINRILRTSMLIAMMRPQAKGGSFVGRSGGGGGFGGFGGGGFGGGGGSWR